MNLIDNRPTLYVRRPGSDAEEVHTFHDDDPFYAEVEAFCSVLEGEREEEGVILSSFEDGESGIEVWCGGLVVDLDGHGLGAAVKTYEMTWAIRRASERSRRGMPFDDQP